MHSWYNVQIDKDPLAEGKNVDDVLERSDYFSRLIVKTDNILK